MRKLLIVSLILFLTACSDFDKKRMFSAHVVSSDAESTLDVKGEKVACLHCPMYFTFNASATVTQAVISRHRLREVRAIPEEIKQIEAIILREVNWWVIGGSDNHEKIYWIKYEPTNPGLDSAFRFLIVRNSKAYFITTGHFDAAFYREITG